MRTILILLAVIAIIALAFYMGWFTVSSTHEEGIANVTLSVDKDKIEADKDKVMDKITPADQNTAD